jgi:seryl-tRNA synthetase
MNKQRRKDLSDLMDRIEDVQKKLSELSDIRAEVEEIKEGINAAKDEEQDYLDNMPEALQNADKGQNAEQAIASLDIAQDALQDIVDALETLEGFNPEDILSNIEDARGEAGGKEQAPQGPQVSDIKPGDTVTFLHWGRMTTGTVARLGRGGNIVWLTDGKWLHRQSVETVNGQPHKVQS